MCSWGVAMSLGPHINLPAQAERTRAAHAAAERAASLTAQASPVEKAFIGALTRRYSDPPPAAVSVRLTRAWAHAGVPVPER
jgi:hypothetical protein